MRIFSGAVCHDADHHAAVGVPDEDDVIELFVVDDLEDIGDVVVEVEVTRNRWDRSPSPVNVGANTGGRWRAIGSRRADSTNRRARHRGQAQTSSCRHPPNLGPHQALARPDRFQAVPCCYPPTLNVSMTARLVGSIHMGQLTTVTL